MPFTVLFYKYGAQVRARCKYASDAERQMNAIMAARKAASKRDEEDNDTSEGKGMGEPVGGASAQLPGPGPGNEKIVPQTMPAEQAGGLGTTAEEGEEEMHQYHQGGSANLDLHPAHPRSNRHHEWNMYMALAERDRVDLRDDERLRLEGLHTSLWGSHATPLHPRAAATNQEPVPARQPTPHEVPARATSVSPVEEERDVAD